MIQHRLCGLLCSTMFLFTLHLSFFSLSAEPTFKPLCSYYITNDSFRRTRDCVWARGRGRGGELSNWIKSFLQVGKLAQVLLSCSWACISCAHVCVGTPLSLHNVAGSEWQKEIITGVMCSGAHCSLVHTQTHTRTHSQQPIMWTDGSSAL